MPAVTFPERPDLDRPRFGDWVSGRDLNGLVEAVALDDVEPADCLLGLHERTVGDDRLPATDADGAGPARRSELVAGDPAPPGLEVVKPRKALLIRGVSRSGLRLGVHLLRVPADKHQELHLVHSNSVSSRTYGRRRRRTEIDISRIARSPESRRRTRFAFVAASALVVLRDPFVLAESHATEPIDRDRLSDIVKGRIF